MKALFYGSLALDDLILPDIKLKGVVGGSASYGALAASLFSEVMIASAVGDDFPQTFIKKLNDRGVDTNLVKKYQQPSFKVVLRYSDDLSQVSAVNLEANAFARFKAEYYKGKLDETGAAFLSKNDPEQQLKLISYLPKQTPVIVESRRAWMIEKRRRLLEVLGHTDVFMVDEEEVEILVGRDMPVPEMIERVISMGPKVVVFKRGEHGLVMYGKKGTFIVPSYPLAFAIDPTGAGDVLGGVIAGVLTRLGSFDEKNMKTAVLLASTVASFTVEGYGTEVLEEVTVQEVINRTKVFLSQLPHENDLKLEWLNTKA